MVLLYLSLMWARTVSGLHSRSSLRDPVFTRSMASGVSPTRAGGPHMSGGKYRPFIDRQAGCMHFLSPTLLKALISRGLRQENFLSDATINRHVRQPLRTPAFMESRTENALFGYFTKRCVIPAFGVAAGSALIRRRGWTGSGPLGDACRVDRRLRFGRGRGARNGRRTRRERRVRVYAREIEQQGFEACVVVALGHRRLLLRSEERRVGKER